MIMITVTNKRSDNSGGESGLLVGWPVRVGWCDIKIVAILLSFAHNQRQRQLRCETRAKGELAADGGGQRAEGQGQGQGQGLAMYAEASWKEVKPCAIRQDEARMSRRLLVVVIVVVVRSCADVADDQIADKV